MKYLLDTVAWLWSIDPVERLGDKARSTLENGREEIYLSAATTWEVSIKARLGKLNFPEHRLKSSPHAWPNRAFYR